MVTIDFGAFGSIDMRDTAGVWADVFASFTDDFDGRYTPFGLRQITHDSEQYQLDTDDGVMGIDPGSGPAVWFYGHDFDYSSIGRPVDGVTHDLHVYSAADVNNDYETYRVFVYGFDASLPDAVDIVESKNLDPLLDGERLKILGHRFDDFLIGNDLSDELYGYGGRDTLQGGAGDDYLDGGADRDRLLGERGNDTLVMQATDTLVSGGSGFDTAKLRENANLTSVPDTRITNIERIDMRGGGGDVLTLNQSDVLAMNSRDELRILGDPGDVVHRGSGWSFDGIVDTFYVYTQGPATLMVDVDIFSVV